MTPRERWARCLSDRTVDELKTMRDVYARHVEVVADAPGLGTAENSLTALREIDRKLRYLK